MISKDGERCGSNSSSSSNAIPEGRRKTSEAVSQGSQSSGRYLNPATSKYEAVFFPFDRDVSRL